METGLCLKELKQHETKDGQAEMMKTGMDGCFPLLRLTDL